MLYWKKIGQGRCHHSHTWVAIGHYHLDDDDGDGDEYGDDDGDDDYDEDSYPP